MLQRIKNFIYNQIVFIFNVLIKGIEYVFMLLKYVYYIKLSICHTFISIQTLITTFWLDFSLFSLYVWCGINIESTLTAEFVVSFESWYTFAFALLTQHTTTNPNMNIKLYKLLIIVVMEASFFICLLLFFTMLVCVCVLTAIYLLVNVFYSSYFFMMIKNVSLPQNIFFIAFCSRDQI